GGAHRKGMRYGVVKANGAAPETVVSERYYLADADFLVGLEGEDEELLHRLNAALAAPVWPLFLGRKAFVPGLPVRLPDAAPWGPGVRPEPLADALRSYPWRDDPRRTRFELPKRLRVVLETADPRHGEARRDTPLSFVPSDRRFALRYVLTTTVQLGGEDGVPVLKEQP
ncbi:MAG: type I-E CRISPR-associated protein Cas5/CasD, partial [Chloroflexi bacterium]|nr:type I-E CRISPR-associated protein Cas5/CasD [Chloroflexota bacterium]